MIKSCEDIENMNDREMNIPEQEENTDKIKDKIIDNEVSIKRLELMVMQMKQCIESIVEEIKHLKPEVNKQKQYEDDEKAINAMMGDDVHFSKGITDGQKAYTSNEIHLWDAALAYCVMNSEIGNDESLKDSKYRYNMGFLRGCAKQRIESLHDVHTAIKTYMEDTGEFAIPEEKLIENMMDKYQLETNVVEYLVDQLSKQGIVIRPCKGYLKWV